MAYTLKDAKTLCSKPEFELVALAHKPGLTGLGAPKLRQKITRARKLRDKFRDESARQTREARGKSDPRGTKPAQGNDRTVMKAEIFADVLGRFESAFEGARTKPAPPVAPVAPVAKKTSKKVAKKTSKKTAKMTAIKAAAGTAGPAKPAARKTAKKSAKKAAKRAAKKVAKKKAGSGPPTRSLTKEQASAAGPAGLSKPRSVIRAGLKSANAGRQKGHVVSRSRAAQAKRDAR